MNLLELQPWEKLAKKITWEQLGDIKGKKILDFGSGLGITANHLAIHNDVVAIEPCEETINNRCCDNSYTQICGDIKSLKQFENHFFDVIICHNVFEYAHERKDIIKEFSRLLKNDGFISIIKHNVPGRVMQMVVLLNDFEHAEKLLKGENGKTESADLIHYYDDTDIEKWCNHLEIDKKMGLRTFWDLQQNQEIQKDLEWQRKMIEMELKVSEVREYQDIAFFSHLILKRKKV